MNTKNIHPIRTAAALLLASMAFGQTATSTLTGTVIDPSGAAVANAEITLTNRARLQKRSVLSSHDGSFVFPLLSPGAYDAEVQKPGFAITTIKGIELEVGASSAIRVELKLRETTESVSVTANAIDETPTVGTVVDRTLLEDVPLNGRTLQTLILLAPGVVPAVATSKQLGQFSVDGQRTSSNYFTVDGVSANTGISVSSNLYGAAGNYGGYNAVGGTNSLVTVDALQEFRIQTSNFAPEFGRTPGAQVSMITRSGSNQFHGSVFEYFRNDVLNANDWFANRQGLSKAPLRQNQFGGVAGGPVIHDKTFFFASFEGLRLRLPQVQVQTVPSLAARAQASGPVKDILNAFPVPNGPELGSGLAQWTGGWSNPSSSNAGALRLDHSFSSRLTAFVRYTNAPSESVQRGASARPASNTFGTYLSTQTVTAAATFLATPKLVNDLRFNYSRNGGDLLSATDSFGGATPLPASSVFPASVSSSQSEVQIYLTSAFSPLLSIGRRTTNRQRQVNLVDSVNYAAGSHQLKLGGDYRRLSPSTAYAPYDQFVYFDSVTQALSGQANEAIVSTFSGPISLRFNELSVYAQDAWRISPRLLLTYGVRWELNRPFSEAKPQLPGISSTNPATVQLLPAGGPLWQTRYGNLAPRVGASYRLRDRPRFTTILRGGAGLFYDASASPAVGTGFGGFAYPYQTFTDTLGPGLSYPLPASIAAAPAPTGGTPPYSIVGFDPKLQLPYSIHYNFGVEQSLGAAQVLSLTYVGAAGRRLYYTESTKNPNPTISQLNVTRNGAESSYNSMQIQFRRSLSQRIQALASYTWSKSLDTTSDEFSVVPPGLFLAPTLERGPSSFDYRHAFTAVATANLPGRNVLLRSWGIDLSMNVLSAPPVNPSFTNAAFGITLRPDLVANAPLYLDGSQYAGGRRINPAAFVKVTGARQGTLGRNALRGFNTNQMNFAVHRAFRVTERISADLRFEAFNILNHPNFASPTPTVGNSLFGLSTQMLNQGLGGLNALYQIGGPRSLQLGAKLRF